jgi:hypothetical protein
MWLTPWYTHQELSSHQHRQVLSKNSDKDSAYHGKHPRQESEPGTIAFLAVTGDDESDEHPAYIDLDEGGLIRCWNVHYAVDLSSEVIDELG